MVYSRDAIKRFNSCVDCRNVGTGSGGGGGGVSDTGVESSSATGLVDSVTGQPIFADYDNDGNVLQLYYFDVATGVKTVTTTGFMTAPMAQNQKLLHEAYETLANGAVERLQQETIFNGTSSTITWVEYGTNTAYAPTDPARVTHRPIFTQMGVEQLAITGATGVALAAVPTAANSKGDNFPKYALIHVNVDGAATDASGIAFTTNGVDPSAAGQEFEVSNGNSIILDSHEEIVGFRALTIGADGEINGALNAALSIEYSNIRPAASEF